MKFEWDLIKNKTNIIKHGLSFELAYLVFNNLYINVPDKRKNYGEDRYCCIGAVDSIIVVVSYTKRHDNIRIISMRKANKKEQRIFNTSMNLMYKYKQEQRELI
jgi:uncharacterized protein